MEFPTLKGPFTSVIAGPTGCGKSYFVRDLLRHRREMFSPVPDRVIWCYGIHQSLYDEIPDVTFVEGFPSNLQDLFDRYTLVIVDDLMSELGNNKRLTHLFTRGSHHMNVSIMFITQNFFHKGKEMREITLNAHYLILFKNRRDMSQLTNIGRQLYPRHLKFFQEVFADATKNPYSYLMIDLQPFTPEDMRLRTQILPNQTQYVYQMKNI